MKTLIMIRNGAIIYLILTTNITERFPKSFIYYEVGDFFLWNVLQKTVFRVNFCHVCFNHIITLNTGSALIGQKFNCPVNHDENPYIITVSNICVWHILSISTWCVIFQNKLIKSNEVILIHNE